MLKNLIKEYISPILKKEGFNKKNLTWNKENKEFIQVINFQLSSYSDSEEQTFTINVGVFHPEVWKICWQKEPSKCVKEYECFPRSRIGFLIDELSPKPLDRWWTCRPDLDTSDLGQELVLLIQNKCVPFLNKFSDINQIIQFYSSFKKNILPLDLVYLSIFHCLNGNKESALEILKDVSSTGKGCVDQIRAVQEYILRLDRST